MNMSYQKALAGIERFNSMVNLPYQGIKGFDLYQHKRNGKETREQMKNDFIRCSKFLDVYRLILEERNDDAKKNIIIYKGFKEVVQDDKDFETQWKERFSDMKRDMDAIIDSISEDRDLHDVSENRVQEYVGLLKALIEQSKRKLSRQNSEYKSMIFGKSAAI